jgi:hypothetical protein
MPAYSAFMSENDWTMDVGAVRGMGYSAGMNRVSALGPIELQSKYFKPPEPPISMGAVRSDLARVEFFCPSCDLTKENEYRLISPRARVVDPRLLQTRVTLTKETYRRGEHRPDGTCWYQDHVAYVGQCERCQRIYIAGVSSPGTP